VARGRFITLEGGEGCGKSTQVRALGAALEGMEIEVVLTREPGGAEGAESIRKLLVEGATDRWDGLTETLLHTAARRNHLVNTVWPALEAGKTVVCDRFLDSTMAYQGYGHGVDQQKISTIHRAAIGDFGPDLTLILDVPVDVGLARVTVRGGTEMRYENMDKEFHERLRKGFQDIAKLDPKRCRIIDASRDEETVQADVLAEVQRLLKEANGSDE
jgi:dTMP kinase